MDYGRDKGEVEKDAGGLGNMKNLGQVIAWLGQAIQPHAGGFPALETNHTIGPMSPQVFIQKIP